MKMSKLELRWLEIELKTKFNSCEEADQFIQNDWSHCPVCGGEIVSPLVTDASNEIIIKH